MESNNGLQCAAKSHLGLLKESHERQERLDKHYVGLAFTYGLTVDQIAMDSGISADRVRALLAGV